MTYHRADAAGNLTVNRPLEVPALTMMHDFAMTSGHVVFMDLPIVFNLDVAINGKGDMPYRWDDGYGARFGVLRRDDPFGRCGGSTSTRATCSTSPTRTKRTPMVLQGSRIPLSCRAVGTRSLWRNDGGFGASAVLWEWVVDLVSAFMA